MENRLLPLAHIKTTFGTIDLELYPEEAPNAVGAFIWAAQQELFDQRKISRVFRALFCSLAIPALMTLAVILN